MEPVRTIYKYIKRMIRKGAECVPYEELFTRYGEEKAKGKRTICEELSRRLGRLVYCAASDYSSRHGGDVNPRKLTHEIFRTFIPEIGAGLPKFGLSRFATCIRNVLDQRAFEYIARALFYQLPLYHLSNDEERRFLAAMLQDQWLSTGPTLSHIEELSERFQVSGTYAEAIVRSGIKHLKQIINNDFAPGELAELTEGYLP